MNINYREPQFELFPANSATLEDINKPRFLLATLTLSTESLVILTILAIMIGLFSFSLGVERGRSLAAKSLDERVAAAWNVGGRRLAAPPIVPQQQIAKPIATTTTKTVTKTLVNRGPVRAVVPQPNVLASRTTANPLQTAKVAASGKWTVQVATYKNANYAQQEALGFKAKGYPTFIVKSKDYFLVCLGQFASQLQANSFFNKIQAKYQGSQVRRI